MALISTAGLSAGLLPTVVYGMSGDEEPQRTNPDLSNQPFSFTITNGELQIESYHAETLPTNQENDPLTIDDPRTQRILRQNGTVTVHLRRVDVERIVYGINELVRSGQIELVERDGNVILQTPKRENHTHPSCGKTEYEVHNEWTHVLYEVWLDNDDTELLAGIVAGGGAATPAVVQGLIEIGLIGSSATAVGAVIAAGIVIAGIALELTNEGCGVKININQEPDGTISIGNLKPQ